MESNTDNNKGKSRPHCQEGLDEEAGWKCLNCGNPFDFDLSLFYDEEEAAAHTMFSVERIVNNYKVLESSRVPMLMGCAHTICATCFCGRTLTEGTAKWEVDNRDMFGEKHLDKYEEPLFLMRCPLCSHEHIFLRRKPPVNASLIMAHNRGFSSDLSKDNTHTDAAAEEEDRKMTPKEKEEKVATEKEPEGWEEFHPKKPYLWKEWDIRLDRCRAATIRRNQKWPPRPVAPKTRAAAKFEESYAKALEMTKKRDASKKRAASKERAASKKRAASAAYYPQF